MAQRHGVDPDQILISGGSIAVLEQLIRAYAGPGDEVVHPWRSYEAYPIIVGAAGATPIQAPLTDAYVDLDAVAGRITPATRVVLVCNPNNPTGTVLAPGVLPGFLDRLERDHFRQSCLVIVDEAYREFVTPGSTDDGVELTRNHSQVAVLRTFSKVYGLAGLRVGYCVADRNVIDAARRVALPFTVSTAALVAARAAQQDDARVNAQIATLVAERERLRNELLAVGVPCTESNANFLWLSLDADSEGFAAACARASIGVRLFPAEGVRITIGSRESSAAVITVAHHWRSRQTRTRASAEQEPA